MIFVMLCYSDSHKRGVVGLGLSLVREIFNRYSLVLGKILKLDRLLVGCIPTKAVNPDHVLILCRRNLLPQILWHLIPPFLIFWVKRCGYPVVNLVELEKDARLCIGCLVANVSIREASAVTESPKVKLASLSPCVDFICLAILQTCSVVVFIHELLHPDRVVNVLVPFSLRIGGNSILFPHRQHNHGRVNASVDWGR